jgi:hypothetical protein
MYFLKNPINGEDKFRNRGVYPLTVSRFENEVHGPNWKKFLKKHLDYTYFHSGIISKNLSNIYLKLATHMAKFTMLWILYISKERDALKPNGKIIYF